MIALQKAEFLAQNAPKSFVPGSARTRWGSLQRSPDPLAAFDGTTSKRGEGWLENGRGEVGKRGENRKRGDAMENC